MMPPDDMLERLTKAQERFSEGLAAIGRAMEAQATRDSVDRWLFRAVILGIMALAGMNVAQAVP
jgi:hypothetical protein